MLFFIPFPLLSFSSPSCRPLFSAPYCDAKFFFRYSLPSSSPVIINPILVPIMISSIKLCCALSSLLSHLLNSPQQGTYLKLKYHILNLFHPFLLFLSRHLYLPSFLSIYFTPSIQFYPSLTLVSSPRKGLTASQWGRSTWARQTLL